jgi:carboxyl-terminal processing protease
MKSFPQKLPALLCVFFLLGSTTACLAAKSRVKVNSSDSHEADDYQEYMAYFQKVFKTMRENYYETVRQEDFDRFVNAFNTKIYAQLKNEKKSSDYVRWRSAAFLVDFLKTKEDVFSALYPPKPAQEYAKEALGERVDLGIDGQKKDAGFFVNHVEPRSDAYTQGLREEDIVIKIDSADVAGLDQKAIEEKLNPLKGSKVAILYLSHEDRNKKFIDVVSKEYYKQTVFLREVPIPGVFCLEIPKFNRMTAEDLLRFLNYVKERNPKGLILDLRGNPGGPPLAAREISAFFLKGNDQFAYFQKKGQDKAELDVPEIPAEYKYDGPMVLLVNKESGSASELFAGIMQQKGRAVLMGENTSGQVMLKSMFDLDDKAMLLLITSRGHYPDGRTFSFNGLDPDNKITPEYQPDLMKIAGIYLYKVSIGEIKL